MARSLFIAVAVGFVGTQQQGALGLTLLRGKPNGTNLRATAKTNPENKRRRNENGDCTGPIPELDGTLIVFAGPSGAGKTTMIKGLQRAFGDKFAFAVSNTTRGPRFNEDDGVDYHFTERDVMEKKIENCDFVEHVENFGNLYGTSYQTLVDGFSTGKKVQILDIDIKGIDQWKLTPYHSQTKYMMITPTRCVLRGRCLAASAWRRGIDDSFGNLSRLQYKWSLDFAPPRPSQRPSFGRPAKGARHRG